MHGGPAPETDKHGDTGLAASRQVALQLCVWARPQYSSMPHPGRAVQFAREGEELSKKQLALESTAKKLRAQQKESDIIRKDLDTKLLMEQQKVRRLWCLAVPGNCRFSRLISGVQ